MTSLQSTSQITACISSGFGCLQSVPVVFIALCYQVSIHIFQLVSPENADKILVGVQPTMCVFDPYSSQLIRTARLGRTDGSPEVVNASLREGHVPTVLKKVAIHPFLEK